MGEIEEVKKRVDIVELISAYVQLRKAGRNFTANCPFHGEKTASFMVSSELQIFKCFGCGEGGDAFKFLMRMEGMEFGEALRFLAKKVGVQLTEYKPDRETLGRERLLAVNSLTSEFYNYLLTTHDLGKKALAYLKSRGVGQEAMGVFKLGWAPDGWENLTSYLTKKKGYEIDELVSVGLVTRKSQGQRVFDRFRRRVMFPLKNHRGDVMGFSGRLLPGDPEEGKTGKYVNTAETILYHKSEMLYGLDITRGEIKRLGVAVVVEGELDMISSWQAGVTNVVAIKGSALTVEQVKLLKRFCSELILALDSDAAGDMAARRGIASAEKEGLSVRVVETGKYKDPDEFARADPEGWKKAVEKAVVVYDFYIDSAISRHGVSSSIAKKKIGQELVPVLSGISDEIMKAHYVGRLAEALGVSEEVVWGEINKVSGPLAQNSKEEQLPEATKISSRRELLEEYLLALGFASEPKLLLKEENLELVKSVWGRKVLERFGSRGEDKFDLREFYETLPEELRGGMGKVMLYGLPEDLAWISKEFEKTKMEIIRLDIKSQLEHLSQEIKEREAKGEDSRELEERFSSMSRGLTDVI